MILAAIEAVDRAGRRQGRVTVETDRQRFQTTTDTFASEGADRCRDLPDASRPLRSGTLGGRQAGCEFVGDDGLQSPGMCRVGTTGGMVSCWMVGRRTRFGISLMVPTWMKEHLSGVARSSRSTSVLVGSSGIVCGSIWRADRKARPRQPTSVSNPIKKSGGSCTRSRVETCCASISTEGVPGGRYRPTWLVAEDIDGESVSAIAYVAFGNETDGKPSHRYISLLRKGARRHRLPDHWVQFLDGVGHVE